PYGAGHVSIFPKTMQALADRGVVVDVIAGNGRLIDLSSVRVEHDLYVLKQISGIPMSMAGALHAQGAAIVNPYPVTVALRDKVIAARMLAAAGAPMPVTYVVSQPDLLTPLLDRGPLVVKPFDGPHGGGEVRRAVRPDCRASRHRAALRPCVRYRPVRRRLDRERGTDVRGRHVQHPRFQGRAGRAVASGVLLLRGGGARRQRATGIPAGGRGRSMKWLIINGE